MCIFAQDERMFNKIKEITEGWKNYMFENPAVEEVAKDRAEVCGECPEPTNGIFKVFDNQTIKFKDVEGLICSKCGCPLSAKTRSPNSVCPLNKWYKMKIKDLKEDLEAVRYALCKSRQELIFYADKKDMRTNINDCFSVAIDTVARAEESVYRATGDDEYTIQPYEERIYRKALNNSRSKEKQIAFVTEQLHLQYNKLVSISKSPRFIDQDNNVISIKPGTFNDSFEVILALAGMLPDIMNSERYKE